MLDDGLVMTKQFSHWLYLKDPQMWQEWANRPDSASREFVEKS